MIPSGAARIAGIMGWPVEHSLSPRLHGYWLEHYRIDGAYIPPVVRPERLGPALRALPDLGFAGVNLTVPHKSAALAHLDSIAPEARRIGAVNTVVVQTDGRLHGWNTDSEGFKESLMAAVPGFDLARRPVVLLGAGGAARAVAAALLSLAVMEIRLVNRSRTRAQELVTDLGGPISVHAWEHRATSLEGCALLVNTTTLGMTSAPELILPLEALARDAVVVDIVYVPLETPLLRAARARGNRVVDGLGMLLHQAVPGFAAWFGRRPAVTEALRRAVLSMS